MAYRIVGHGIYEALLAEGFTLPPECGDLTLEIPVDGLLQLHYRENLCGDRLAAVGRALIRIADQTGPTHERLPARQPDTFVQGLVEFNKEVLDENKELREALANEQKRLSDDEDLLLVLAEEKKE